MACDTLRFFWAVLLTPALPLVALAQTPDADSLPPGVIRMLAWPVFHHAPGVDDLVVVDAGNKLVTASGEGTIVWDMATGKRLKTLPTGPVRSVAVAPAGDLLAIGSLRGTLSVVELATDKLKFVKQLKAYAIGLAFSPDGSLVASAGADADIQLWNTTTGAAVATLTGHTSDVLDIVFHPGGKRLYSIGGDHTLREWGLATCKETRRLTEPPHWWTTGLAVSADGKTLAVTACTGSGQAPEDRVAHVRLLDTKTLTERFRAVVPQAWASCVAVSPDGRFVGAGFSQPQVKTGHVRTWDSWTGKETALGASNKMGVHHVRFTGDGKTLVGAGDDKSIHLWHVANGVEDAVTQATPGLPVALAFAPSGEMLASATNDGLLQLWDTLKGVRLHVLPKKGLDGKPPDYNCALVFSPDGALVLSTTAPPKWPFKDGALLLFAQLWNVRTGECVRTLKPETDWGAAFAPEGKTLAVTTERAVQLFDVATAKPLRQLTASDNHHVGAFSPDGHLLVSLVSGEKAALWHVATGRCLKELETEAWRTWFSPDGSLLFVESYGVGMELFETASGMHLLTLDVQLVWKWQQKGVRPNVSAQRVVGTWQTHGGATLVVALVPSTFRVFDLVSGKTLGPDVGYGGNFTSLQVTRDGRMLALGYEDGGLLLWKPPPLPPRQPLAVALDEVKLRELWKVLAGEDAQLAYQARWLLSAAPKQTLPLLRQELRAVPWQDAEQVKAWIAQLDSPLFKERSKAMQKLEEGDESVARALRKALEQKPSLEVRRRIDLLLGKLEGLPTSGEKLRTLRAIVILEAIGGDEALALLRTLAGGAPESRVTQAAAAALKRMSASGP
jgi:WD40 repeat protein